MGIRYNELPIGTEIYYTGDMANQSGFGKITDRKDDRWGRQYEITLKADPSEFGEEYSIPERKFRIGPAQLKPSPGRRFKLLTEYEAERQAALAALRKASRQEGNR